MHFFKKFEPTKTIGVFGGSFDPIHLGHSKVVNEFLKAAGPNTKIIFIPTQNGEHPYGKNHLFSREDRVKMIRIDFGLLPDFEIRKPQDKYTYEELVRLQGEFGINHKIVFLCGGDITAKEIFEKWQYGDQILIKFPVFQSERDNKFSSTAIRTLFEARKYTHIPDSKFLQFMSPDVYSYCVKILNEMGYYENDK